jgi:hypothetical protein
VQCTENDEGEPHPKEIYLREEYIRIEHVDSIHHIWVTHLEQTRLSPCKNRNAYKLGERDAQQNLPGL